jgi:hypothetical protein
MFFAEDGRGNRLDAVFGVQRVFKINANSVTPFALGREDNPGRGIFGVCVPETMRRKVSRLQILISHIDSGSYVLQNRGTTPVWIERPESTRGGKLTTVLKLVASRSGLHVLPFGSRIRFGNSMTGGAWYTFNVDASSEAPSANAMHREDDAMTEALGAEQEREPARPSQPSSATGAGGVSADQRRLAEIMRIISVDENKTRYSRGMHHYAILNLEHQIAPSLDDIHRSWRRLQLSVHPDHHCRMSAEHRALAERARLLVDSSADFCKFVCAKSWKYQL